MRRARFEVYQDAVYDWRWRLVAQNGQIIADSGQGYTRRRDAVRAITSVASAIIDTLPEPDKSGAESTARLAAIVGGRRCN